MPGARSASEVLLDASLDDAQRLAELLPAVYDQLRAAAQQALLAERPGHTLQATALVNEAYLRLVGDRQVPWANQQHFYVAAAEAMRRVLLDHARARGRVKRGGGRSALDITTLADLAEAEAEDIVRFDEAIRRLEEESADAAMVVRLRFFAGLSVDQAASALGVSPATVDRRWALARAWLFSHLGAAR